MINKIVKSKNRRSGIILLLSILLCENLFDLAAWASDFMKSQIADELFECVWPFCEIGA